MTHRIEPLGGLRQRMPRERDRPYLLWIKKLPCVACAVRGSLRYGAEAAHIKVGYPEAGPWWRPFGHAENSHDRRAVPLCARCHREGPEAQHRNMGGDERAFWARLGIHPPELCTALALAYDAGRSGEKVVRDFAERAAMGCPRPPSMP